MTPMGAGTIYKLLTRAEWEAAQEEGVYRGSAHDMRDGFIHFSTAAQLADTARKHFSGVAGLVLLAVEIDSLSECLTPHPATSQPPSPSKLALASLPLKVAISASGYGGGEGTTSVARASPLPLRERGRGEGALLRFEPARGGDLFPHLYAPLPISAVKSVTAIALLEDGTPIIPADLET